MSSRRIAFRHQGTAHGFIRRIISPGDDVGEALKPFVFLDHLDGAVPKGMTFGFHPHSGIATLTYQLDGDVAYEDTTGQNGVVRARGLEWMRAGGGTWHTGTILPHGPSMTGFQLWLALPPGVEDGPAEGIYVAPESVPRVGSVSVLLGEYSGLSNPIPAPSPLTYLHVELEAGEEWSLQPAPGHDIAWAYVYRGRVHVAHGDVGTRELVVFDRGPGELRFAAPERARFLIGTARRHEHPLVLGPSSVHTNAPSLARGHTRIDEIGADLRRRGKLSR